ncbi:Ser/Thr protein phosphatase [Ephemerocybe angulata]|uniref:Ser/Thr protein phosphatase n=1 Tax=Ephemerocybe angulata TaxID=980116 RepID=A0A8H6H910_9AGAR|nr:Ser/Thr protein phosphatase [Tulosesus angulatus]
MQSSRPASTSTRPPVSPLPRTQYQVNTQTNVIDTAHGRILCVADIRGRLSALNDLARDANAKAIIHTGDFGFFESSSLDKINDRTLRHLTMYSPLIPSAQRTHLLSNDNPPSVIRATVNIELLSEFPLLLSGQIKLQVPVYTVWGACEDVLVIEKFRSGAYSIENLHVLDEATTRCLDVGGVKLRLLGLGGAFVPHKLFDNGDGNATIAGGQGTMWTTALQIGELVDTAQRVFDQSETRLFVSHASPGREGIIAQLALVLKADLTISAGLHFRYATSYNEFSVQGDFEGFRHKLSLGKEAFDKVWETVKTQVDAVIDDNQRILLEKALSVVERLPPSQPTTGPAAAGEEPAWKNCWNWNLCDAAYGSLVLDVKEGRVSAELKSQGFNYAYRRTATVAPTPNATSSPLPPAQNNLSTNPPTKASTPAPERPLPPHLANKSTPSTPPPNAGDSENPDTSSRINGASTPSEKDKGKRKDKKDKKDRGSIDNGTSTPDLANSTSSTAPADTPTNEMPDTSKTEEDGVKSPTDGSGGNRTPKTGKPARNPWTIFMRWAGTVQATEAEIRDFYNEAKEGITRVNIPPPFAGRARLAYVEFGDEDAMKAGFEKHSEKLKDIIPEVKQAIDRDNRDSFRGRGRGRGGSGFATRGLAATGLIRGGHSGPGPRGD